MTITKKYENNFTDRRKLFTSYKTVQNNHNTEKEQKTSNDKVNKYSSNRGA